VPVLAVHGVHDEVVPFEAGRVLGVFDYLGARAETAGWAVLNGCASAPAEERIADHVVREEFADCAGGAATALLVVEDGGHTWPGAIPIPGLGATNDEIDASALIWEFFTQHSLE
jgi:polyhydroxybutyrate depolymerase